MRLSIPEFGTLFVAALLIGCNTQSTGLEDSLSGPDLAPGGSSLYQLQFIVETNQGEITSPPFPANGIALNTKDPWKNLTVNGAALSLNNYTHGDWSICAAGQTRDVQVNWDIDGATPVRSFAGSWQGELKLWRGRSVLNLAFAGPRLLGAEDAQGVDGVAVLDPPDGRVPTTAHRRDGRRLADT